MPNGKRVKLTAGQKEKLLSQVRRHRQEAIDARGGWAERHDVRYRRFLSDVSLRPEPPWPEGPRLFTGHTRSVVERLQAEFWLTLFQQEESVKLEGFGEEDVKKAEKATKFERWALRNAINSQERGGFKYLAQMVIFDSLVDSTGILKIYPWKVPWQAPSNSARFLDTIIRMDVVDMGHMLIPPGVQGLQYPDAPYVGQQMFLRPDDLLRRKKRNSDDQDGFDLPSDLNDLKLEKRELSQREKTEEKREELRAEAPSETIELDEMYERFVLEGDLEEDVIVSFFPNAADEHAIGKVVRLIDALPQDDRPRRPFFDITIWPQPRQLRGLNVPDRLETPQDVINRLFEQLVNYGDVSMLPFFFYNALITGDIPDLRQVKPGQGVPVNDTSGVQMSRPNSLNKHFVEQVQFFGAEIERDVKVSDFTLGRQPDRPNAPRTASATLALLEESKRSFSILIWNLASQFEAALGFHFSLWQKFLQPGARARIQSRETVTEDDIMNALEDERSRDLTSRLFSDPESLERTVAQPITRDELSGTFDARLEVNPNAAFERQALTQLGERILPVIQPRWPLGARNLLKRIWEAHGFKGFDSIYPEFVADLETRLTASQVQVQLTRLQGELQRQMQGAPVGGGDLGGLEAGGSGGGAAPDPTAGGPQPTEEEALAQLLREQGGNGAAG